MNSIWIARDKDGDLFAFLSEPTRYEEKRKGYRAGETENKSSRKMVYFLSPQCMVCA